MSSRTPKALLMASVLYLLLLRSDLCSGDSSQIFEVEQSSGYRFAARALGFGCIPVCETMDGYEIMQIRDDGDWYYVVRSRGYRIASPYAVGQLDPSALGLQKHGQSTAEELGIASSGTGIASTSASSIGTRMVLIVFGKLKGDPDPYDPETDYRDYDGQPESIDHFLLPDYDGSLGHFMKVMSGNRLILRSKMEGDIDIPLWYESDSSLPSDYPSPWIGARKFAREVFEDVDANPPPGFSFADYDGDDDGYVDLVVFIYDRTRLDGFVDGTIGFSGHETRDGVTIGDYTIFKSTVGFELEVGGTAHEFGHILDLPELYDATTQTPEEDSAGLGLWALMARGAAGWADAEWWPGRKWNNGPSPFCVWSRIRVGWLTPEPITSTMFGVTLSAIDHGGDACKIVPDPIHHPEEYFLICNRQASGSYYTRDDPSSGLFIYHVDDSRFAYPQSNNREKHKTVDLECPDGLFLDKGYPGNDPDPAYGGDNLDFWAHDSAYRHNHNGNKGDSGDVFDGLIHTSFTPYTNPSSNGHNGDVQSRTTHLAVADIHRGNGTDMVADFVLNYWSGLMSTDTVWENDAYGNPVYLGGDVTVIDGVTLTILEGTTVCCNGYSVITGGSGIVDDQGAIFVDTCTPDSAVLYGDVSDNGGVTSYDAALILQHTVTLVTLAGRDSVAADVSGMEGISSYDASLVLQYAVDKIDRFPVE